MQLLIFSVVFYS